MRLWTWTASLVLGVSATLAAEPAASELPKQVEADWVDNRLSRMNTGPFYSGSIHLPAPGGGGIVPKGIVVKLDGGKAAAIFDTELLTWRAAWTGGFLKHDPARFGLIGAPRPEGQIAFVNSGGSVWVNETGKFIHPRPAPYGPMPREHGRYKGLYLHGDRVLVAYDLAGVDILESPMVVRIGDRTFFVRELTVGPRTRPITMNMGNGATLIASTSAHGASWTFATGEQHSAAFDPSDEPSVYRLIALPPDVGADELSLIKAQSGNIADVALLTKGGPPRWGDPLVTRGTVSDRDDALAIDTITVPYENPWNALMFIGGHDFFSNGDAAVCTIHGDVWLVSGIDDDLDEIKWKRFATGLYQPLGLKIVDDKIYVTCRDQITRLHDENGDGEADFYENFNNEGLVSGGGHEYVTGLETDAAGNFYFLKCAGPIAHGGTLLRIPGSGAASGSGIEVVATGFRNPNGMSIGPAPSGIITVADQQGEWVPATRIDDVRPGGFYGFQPMHHRDMAPDSFDGPLCWVPRDIDNSAGGQVWVPPGSWGPLGGQLLHLSYGRCTMMLVLRDEVDGLPQGAVVPLPGRFLSGVMRGRFSPHDGHLYLTGTTGWTTAAVRDGCFQRVRYNPDAADPICVPIAFSAHPDGLSVTFSQPLDSSTAQDIESYALERWNYLWSEKYGSEDWSVSDPQTRGRDRLVIEAAKLSDDGRRVFLTIRDMRPAMQMQLRYELDTAAGQIVRGAIYPTVHRLHQPRTDSRP